MYIYTHICLIDVNIIHEVVRKSMLCHVYKWALYSQEVQLKSGDLEFLCAHQLR